MIKKIGLIAFGIPTLSFAAHTLPTFANQWYTHAELTHVNSCGEPNYHYQNLTSNPEQLMQRLLPEKPGACARVRIIKMESNNIPSAYMGNPQDWLETIRNKQAKPTQWTKECLDSNNRVISQQSITMHPLYTCPQGSRYDVSDAEGVGCTTTPTPCAGDVVAHDLFIKEFNFLGHIGLAGASKVTHRPNTVLEIVGHNGYYFGKMIRESKLDYFKTFHYWGEKYGIHRKQPFTLNQGYQIIHHALQQKFYDPVYTFFWNWRPGNYQMHYIYDPEKGKFIKHYALTQAHFRCDGFVHYAYHSTGLDIVPDYGFPHSPLSLYKALKFERTPDPDANGIPIENNDSDLLSFAPKHSVVTAKQLQAAVLDPNTSAETLTQSLQSYLNTSDDSDSEKAKKIWELAQKFKDDKVRFHRILEALFTQRALDITEDLIGAFYYTDDLEAKFIILEILGESARLTNYDDAQDLTPEELEKIVGIQQFLGDIFETDQEKHITREAFLLYSDIMPAEIAWDTLESITQKRPDLYDSQDLIIQKLSLALANPNMQATVLPRLIHTVAIASPEHVAEFNHALFRLIVKLDNKHITSPTRALLRQYIATAMPIKMNYDLQAAENYDEWLQASAKINTQSEAEKQTYFISHIKSLGSPTLLSLLLLIDDDTLIKHLSTDEIAIIKKRLQNNLNNPNIKETERMYHLAVFAKLANLNKDSDADQDGSHTDF